MKRMIMVLMMVFTLVGCATTPTLNENTIKENKLTSASYLKKVCEMELLQKDRVQTIYVLDNGKGFFAYKKGLAKSCVILRDGELYGRTEMYLPHHVTAFVNLHDDIATQVSFKEGNKLYYLTEDALLEITKDLKDEMMKLAKNLGLTEGQEE